MAGSFQLRERARQDIKEAGVQGRITWGTQQSDAYLDALERAFETLAQMPRIGRACDDIAEGLRRYPCGAHVIFYSLGPNDVPVIERVLHGRMEPELHLGERDTFEAAVRRHAKEKGRDDPDHER